MIANTAHTRQGCLSSGTSISNILSPAGIMPHVASLIFCGMALCAVPGKSADGNLLANGDCERGQQEWNAFWARDMGRSKASIDTSQAHAGKQAWRIDHADQDDWSLAHSLILHVQAGEIYELSVWVRVCGSGSATLGVVTRDGADKTLNWAYGARQTSATKSWRMLRSRFIIPPGTTTIWPRLIGNGPASVWCDDFTLTRQGTLATLRAPDLPATVSLHNALMDVTFHTAHATFDLTHRRSNQTWSQNAEAAPMVVLKSTASARGLDIKLLDPESMQALDVNARLDGDSAEMVVTVRGEGEMENPLAWPAAFASVPGEQVILPVNEGISYPADDASIPEMHYHCYGGHGLCMPWFGAVTGNTGWMAILETPDDAAVSIKRRKGLLEASPEWEPQKLRFGPPRVIRYVISDRGGYVAMAHRYRDFSIKSGLFKTLLEKRKSIAAVDQLVGAVNIWCWDRDAVSWCRKLQSLGIQRILWSNALPPDQIKTLNSMGVLTSRYDIYQDAMNPENFPRIAGTHPDWTSEAWKNDDLMRDADGDWVRGWEVETKDGTMLPCGTLCDRQAVAYAKRRIPPELATHPYRCRFLDTTTASPWRDCYHPQHPMTRTDSKGFKMDLLRYVSEGCGLVCGSETGHDAAVPFVHYFEGMLSLGPYRAPDSGRDIARILNEVPEPVSKFQTGHAYRLPLWELVYHDCVVAQWYWGDYNNKLPQVWDRRDLWNALYGTPPMFMFDRKFWEANQDRFLQSYLTTTPVARATGYSRMLSHEWLTADHAVQQTRFANGVVVTANFGTTPHSLADGTRLQPLTHRVEGLTPPAPKP